MLPTHPDRLSDTELDQWIRKLVDIVEPEGTLLDYKREINASKQSERRELAKDVASFANEVGGTIIYGIPEQQGQPQAAPVPARPYGIDPVPGLEQNLENILSTTIAPLLPEYRIRRVDLSEYPCKVCYLVWIPESWAGPHMVHGYRDGRYYRRGQFRAVIMSERDVEERYRRRLLTRNATNEFIDSEDALHLGRSYGRQQAKTTLMIVPVLTVPNMVTFTRPPIQEWLKQNPLWRGWIPSMYGVRTSAILEPGDKSDVEIHRNGAIIAWRYTAVDDIGAPPLIAYRSEFYELESILRLAARFYSSIAYSGPLVMILQIHCPEQYTLSLPLRGRRRHSIALEPNGRSFYTRVEPSAAELTANPNAVLKAIADEVFRAFGLWEADCFDARNRLVRS